MKDWIWKSFVLFCFSINERKKGRWKLVDGRMEWFDGRMVDGMEWKKILGLKGLKIRGSW